MRKGLAGWAKRYFASPIFIYLLAAIIFGLITVHHLGSRPAGLSPAEAAARSSSLNISAIRHSPLNAPHNLLALGLHHAGLHWTPALRLSSVLFAAAFLFSFAFLLRAWFGRWIGLMGTVLLAGTPLFLVAARQGSAEIMYFGIAAIMAVYVWLLRGTHKDLSMVCLLVIVSILAYSPGLILWILAATIIGRKKIGEVFSELSPLALTAGVLLSALILSPLIISIVQHPTIGRQLMLVPAHLQTSLIIIKKIAWSVIAIFIEAPTHQNLILDRLPLLDVIQDALLVFGAYALWSAAKAKLLIIILAVGYAAVAAGFYNDYNLLILGLPALVVVICAGLRYL